MKDYSQSGEQAFILKYFGSKIRSFLDIGCNDLVTFSNTRALSLKGWSGVFVDASPMAYEKMMLNKLENQHNTVTPNYHYFNFALSDFNGEKILHESGSLVSKEDVALVSTFHQSEIDRFKSKVKYHEVKVLCCSWETFYNVVSPRKQYTMISMDIEGEEMNVLPYMDFEEMETELVVIEWNSNSEIKANYEPYFKKFKLIYTSAENLIYAR